MNVLIDRIIDVRVAQYEHCCDAGKAAELIEIAFHFVTVRTVKRWADNNLYYCSMMSGVYANLADVYVVEYEGKRCVLKLSSTGSDEVVKKDCRFCCLLKERLIVSTDAQLFDSEGHVKYVVSYRELMVARVNLAKIQCGSLSLQYCGDLDQQSVSATKCF